MQKCALLPELFVDLQDNAEQQVSTTSKQDSWHSSLERLIQDCNQGFDTAQFVRDCRVAATSRDRISKVLIFSALKSAGIGPMLAVRPIQSSV